MHQRRGSKGKNFTPLNSSSSSHLLLIVHVNVCLGRWSHEDSLIFIVGEETITRRSRSFHFRWYIHRSISISRLRSLTVPPVSQRIMNPKRREKTDQWKRSRRRTRNYQLGPFGDEERTPFRRNSVPYNRSTAIQAVLLVVLGFTA